MKGAPRRSQSNVVSYDPWRDRLLSILFYYYFLPFTVYTFVLQANIPDKLAVQYWSILLTLHRTQEEVALQRATSRYRPAPRGHILSQRKKDIWAADTIITDTRARPKARTTPAGTTTKFTTTTTNRPTTLNPQTRRRPVQISALLPVTLPTDHRSGTPHDATRGPRSSNSHIGHPTRPR